MSVYQLPLVPGQPQSFSASLGGTTYQLSFRYRDTTDGGWVLDIADDAGNPIVNGIALVTGCNLLGQYAHLGFTGGLFVQTTTDPDAVPTFQNLGTDGLVYWVTP